MLSKTQRQITLKELKRRISIHYYNEADIMNDMLDAKLSKEEIKELQEFMLNHPFSKLCNLIQRESGKDVKNDKPMGAP